MTTLSYLSGFQVAALDNTPIIQPSAGEFAPAALKRVDDWIAIPAAGLSQYSTLRLCRFPTGAKVKSVIIATDTTPDSNGTPQLAFYCDVAFSDSPQDGTPVALQGQIPTTAGYGVGNPAAHAVVAAATTPPKPGAYSAPNNIFGTLTLGTASGAIPPLDLMWSDALRYTNASTSTAGTGCGGYTAAQISTVPLYQVFGFSNNALTVPQDPGGYFDLLFTVKTVAATAAAYTFYASVTYS